LKTSNYNLCLSYDEQNNKGYILYNTKSCQTFEISLKEYNIYIDEINAASCVEDLVKIPLLHKLINRGFIIDENVNELEEIQLQHRSVRRSNQSLSLTITPTMSCNLACSYCFELNKYAGLMLPDVQDNLIKFVEKSFKTGCKKLAITWFGGEPLIGLSIIEYLSSEFIKLCSKYRCSYNAVVITNGTLLTKGAIEVLKRSKVNVIQITLDGPQHIHDTKRIGHGGEPSFELILANLKNAAPHFNIVLRINTDKIVAPYLEDLIGRLSRENLVGKISIYSALSHKTYKLSDEYMNEDRIKFRLSTTNVKAVKVNEEYQNSDVLFNTITFSNIETNFDSLSEKYGFQRHMRLPQRRYNTCMLDKDNSWLIEADGDIQKCWESAGDKAAAVGKLTDDGISLFKNFENWYKWDVFKDPVCNKCPFIPVCMGHCPIRHMAKDPDHCPTFKFNWKDVIEASMSELKPKHGDTNDSRCKPNRHVSKHGRINLLSPILSQTPIKDLSLAVIREKREGYKNRKYLRRNFRNVIVKDEIISNQVLKVIYSGKKRLFYLNKIGYDIWCMLNGKNTVEDILTYICQQYNIEENEKMNIEYDFWSFMKQLMIKKYLDTSRIIQP
jgi:uncharacterized protein